MKKVTTSTVENAIIYVTISGQNIRQENDKGNNIIPFWTFKNSNIVEKCKCHGQDSFTEYIWSTDFISLSRWANDWSYTKDVHFYEDYDVPERVNEIFNK